MRVLTFPENHSVGSLLIGEQYNKTSWDEAVEAKGKIEVSESKYVSFWLGPKLSSSNLNFLSSLKSDDLNEFLAASSHFDDSNIEKILHLSNLDSLQL